ncbi:bifunctional pyrazinamidase/nicotinamidase [Marinobacterium nitratireducens]|uniref:nicotinamidase n=1 Tax=Marinobacterium nitratireducens TaxID=518897 RepID=A0A917ZNK8_9GAMM|nr:isochorismatase family protein [Marinobacterium nitratireducens]GGO87157.1 bifunctional pyrazinamidase/nicotinamidase [Marinobacterium nitratireducens]
MRVRDELKLGAGDALVLVDVQQDFLPGGHLGVEEGDRVVPPLNRMIGIFRNHGLPVVATRDWHPLNHCSFREQGGPWPPHCVQHTHGADWAPELALPEDAMIVSKGDTATQEAYSGFQGTDLADRLHRAGVRRLFIGGLATDYCVLQTVLDACAQGFDARVLEDAIRAVGVEAGDADHALQQMRVAGAKLISSQDLADANV